MAGDDEPQGQHYNFDTGDILESSEAWWRARGKTAYTAANDLEALAARVEPLFRDNHWGNCVEGFATHDLFRGVITTWIADLLEQAAAAHRLSEACFAAARTIAEADGNAADTIDVSI
ncbi:MAG: hypothetical protein WAV90_23970 [Gordonia amarae]